MLWFLGAIDKAEEFRTGRDDKISENESQGQVFDGEPETIGDDDNLLGHGGSFKIGEDSDFSATYTAEESTDFRRKMNDRG